MSIPQLSGGDVTRYGPGAEVDSPEPADFILTHANTVTSQLIRAGQKLRYFGRDRKYTHWSHAGIFVNHAGDLIEAVGSGVQQRNISVYKDTEYYVVRLRNVSASERAQAVRFAEHCLSQRYAWLTLAGVALSLLSGSRFSWGVDGQQICSALVARALERTGQIFVEEEPWHITPAGLAKHFGAEPEVGGARGKIPRTRDAVQKKAARYWIRKEPTAPADH
jgi:uncharacterized protein YycO